jgi:type VI secretion system protein ImpK
MTNPSLTLRRDTLALLYQGLFTAVVRIQTGRQQISNAAGFQKRMREAMAEVAREAIKRNYAAEHTIEADFAMVSFLDEAILTSHDPCRDEWAQNTLANEMFQTAIAGELFFSRIDKLMNRPDSPELSDILEVYVLCLLLGFEGKYAVGGRAELQMLVAKMMQRIERIRGPQALLSPDGMLRQERIEAPPEDPVLRPLRLGAGVAAGVAVVAFVAYFAHLLFRVTGVREALAKALVS